MLGSIIGPLGSGKTLFLTFLAESAKPDRDIYSNFNLNLDNAQTIDVKDLETIDRGLILLDEAYLWLDSRISQSKLNRYMSRFIFQSRKRGFDIFVTSQLQSAIDLRFRHIQDVQVACHGEKETYHKENIKKYFKYTIVGWGNKKTFKLPFEYARENLFPIYDTLEYPDETEPTQFEPSKYNEKVENLNEMVLNEVNDDVRITKAILKDILLEKGEYSEQLLEGVYARLKRKNQLT